MSRRFVSQKSFWKQKRNASGIDGEFTGMDVKLHNLLAESVAQILRQAVEVLSEIDDELYRGGANGGALGDHFRHCLEFVNGFLSGVQIGKIDYNLRPREPRLETDRRYAADEFRRAIKNLRTLATQTEAGKSLLVKPEDIAQADRADFWCRSSLERELEFMQSHTIHHYALIAFKLRAEGFAVAPEFGVAPSTLRFWAAEQEKKRAVRGA